MRCKDKRRRLPLKVRGVDRGEDEYCAKANGST